MTENSTKDVIILLRGINVGKAKRISMSDFGELLGRLGYARAKTVLNSGNAILFGLEKNTDIQSLARRVEAAVLSDLNISTQCFARTSADFRNIINGLTITVPDGGGSKLMVFFLATEPGPAVLAAHDPAALWPDTVQLGNLVVYQWCPHGMLAAPSVGTHLESVVGVDVTARNWNTVLRLAKLAGVAPDLSH